VVALLGAASATAQVEFTRYFALGDSLTAGFVSGGLHQFYQERSYPGMLATQAQAFDFQMPLVTDPGLPNLLELQSLSPLVIAPAPGAPGLPINAELERPYNNLGVPGANLFDFLFTAGDIENLLLGNQDNVMHDLILRIPAVDDPDNPGEQIAFTALTQAVSQNPTFATLWIGNNDVLGAALYGTPIDGVTMTPVDTFQQLYSQALGGLVLLTDADVVAITLPYATDIPFVTTLAPYLDVPGVGRVPLIGSRGPLPENAFVTLGASSLLAEGIGIPVDLGGTGLPLPEDLMVAGDDIIPGVVLRQDEDYNEVAVINGRIDAFNDIIRATAAGLGVPVFDANRIFADISAGDYPTFGGIELTPDLLVGGIFSYDGVHPQNIGYALITIELIDFINATWGMNIPQVNMDRVLCAGGCADQGPPAAFAKDAVLSAEAFGQLLEAFPLLRQPTKFEGIESAVD
jgi:hypothetical protein